MILEGIKDFTREPFCLECAEAGTMSLETALETANKLENRAVSYYQEAALKIKALPEVSRALKTIGKKHTAHLKKLESAL